MAACLKKKPKTVWSALENAVMKVSVICHELAKMYKSTSSNEPGLSDWNAAYSMSGALKT